jgi:hypothetical protein
MVDLDLLGWNFKFSKEKKNFNGNYCKKTISECATMT